MATNDTNRVSKDTSARKQPNILSNAKAQADEMRNQWVLQKLEEGYENRIAELEAAHANEITALKTQVANLEKGDEQQMEKVEAAHAREVAALQAQRQMLQEGLEKQMDDLEAAHAKETALLQTQIRQAFQAGEASAESKSGVQIALLNDSIKEWKRKYRDAQSELDGSIEDKSIALAVVKADVYRIRNESNELEAKKNHEIANLKRQAAIEIVFKCKGGSPRTYLRRPGTLFNEAMKELCKDVQRPVERMRFFTSAVRNLCYNTIGADWEKTLGIREIVPGSKTLEEVCRCFVLCL